MAFWAEAVTYSHLLWGEEDVNAARRALNRLAPSRDARIARAKTAREQAYGAAVEALFADGEQSMRVRGFAEAMRGVTARYQDDIDAAALTSLALLFVQYVGQLPPDQRQVARNDAVTFAQRVFTADPRHPGGAHYLIHATDDPERAPVGLEAARRYAEIAPESEHALHMPSHIFVQLGLWPDAIESNVVAYKAAVDQIARLGLREGREDFHALSWLIYAELMAGRPDDAERNVELARQTADRHPSDGAMRNYYLGMRALYIMETGQWEAMPVAEGAGADDGHACMSGMSGVGAGYNGSDMWTFVAGMSAAKRGDLATAEKAQAQLRARRARTESAGNAYAAKSFALMEKELAALAKLALGRSDEAVPLAKEAADIELTLNPPSGPPDPIKPALELYGDILLAAGRVEDAASAYEQALLRTPNRTPTVKGLARAREKANAPAAGARR
jgi:tetratricopeptide (TPR) repeat protein